MFLFGDFKGDGTLPRRTSIIEQVGGVHGVIAGGLQDVFFPQSLVVLHLLPSLVLTPQRDPLPSKGLIFPSQSKQHT